MLDALKRVREWHPYALSGAIAPSEQVDAEVGRLWDEVLRCGSGSLEELIARLTELQVRLLLYGGTTRVGRADCRVVLDRLFMLRNPEGHDRLAWTALVLGNGGDGLREAAGRCATGLKGAVAMVVAQARLPFDECIGHYRRAGTSFLEWLNEFRGLVLPDGLISREVRRRLLAEASEGLPSEHEVTICNWLKECYVESEKRNWYAAFLRRTAAKGWNARSPIMIAIVGRFGHPRLQDPFWAQLDSEVCDAVQRWILDQKLTEFLSGERLEFWRAYVNKKEIKELYPLGSEAIVIVFQSVLAIQFKEMGRATYLFARQLLTRFRAYEGMHADQTAALYREVLDQNGAGKALGRYEHRGYGWQGSARWEVDRVLREAGDA
jgi:hypothetical protein